MGEFSAEWLALREPADRRARSMDVASRVVERIVAARGADAATRVLDLGTGTGANVRCLLPQLPQPQHWCLIDRDVELLRQLPKRVAAWALDRGAVVSGDGRAFVARGTGIDCRFETRAADLSKVADAALFDAVFEGRALVTASALLDLVSERWLESLVARCRTAGAAVLFALTFDGRLTCTPDDRDDEWIRALINRHQHGAKGFGRALGPDAAAVAVRLFEQAGYEVIAARSDWVLSPSERPLQRALIDGWAGAAAEIARKERDRVAAWLQRRLDHLDAGRSHVTVGHQDIGGWPRDGQPGAAERRAD